ncbi:MAG TPA: hypothetical protein VNG51_00455 [Ktedonobacteraceae bacterium]|nr:hypothetical protein [Ktedonobacteraceae bacterium]
MKYYRVALWKTAVSATRREISVEADNALAAAILAMRANQDATTGVVIVMSAEQQETFFDAHLQGDTLIYSRTAESPRFTDKPFIWKDA